MAMTNVPNRVGPYGMLREIGRGGMGVVYLARDERLDRDVAIKALPEELASDPVRLERFEREARTLAQLNHPNVAGIYGVEEQDGQKYLILEHVEGKRLASGWIGGRCRETRRWRSRSRLRRASRRRTRLASSIGT